MNGVASEVAASELQLLRLEPLCTTIELWINGVAIERDPSALTGPGNVSPKSQAERPSGSPTEYEPSPPVHPGPVRVHSWSSAGSAAAQPPPPCGTSSRVTGPPAGSGVR